MSRHKLPSHSPLASSAFSPFCVVKDVPVTPHLWPGSARCISLTARMPICFQKPSPGAATVCTHSGDQSLPVAAAPGPPHPHQDLPFPCRTQTAPENTRRAAWRGAGTAPSTSTACPPPWRPTWANCWTGTAGKLLRATWAAPRGAGSVTFASPSQRCREVTPRR